MPRVSIITDSAAMLDQETAEQLGITVLPLTIHIGSETFREGIDISSEQFLARLRQPGANPTISAPGIEEYHRVFSDLSEKSDVILALHVSSKLKNVVQTARRAAASFVGSSKIEVLDTEAIAIPQGILVKAAAEAAAAGEEMDDIIRLMRGMIPHMYAIFFVESLEYLKNDGRVGVAQAILGTMLGIKPLLTIEDGDIILWRRYATARRRSKNCWSSLASSLTSRRSRSCKTATRMRPPSCWSGSGCSSPMKISRSRFRRTDHRWPCIWDLPQWAQQSMKARRGMVLPVSDDMPGQRRLPGFLENRPSHNPSCASLRGGLPARERASKSPFSLAERRAGDEGESTRWARHLRPGRYLAGHCACALSSWRREKKRHLTIKGASH